MTPPTGTADADADAPLLGAAAAAPPSPASRAASSGAASPGAAGPGITFFSDYAPPTLPPPPPPGAPDVSAFLVAAAASPFGPPLGGGHAAPGGAPAAAGDAPWAGVALGGAAAAIERSDTLRSSASDRCLPRAAAEPAPPPREPPLALQLRVVAGPCSGAAYATPDVPAAPYFGAASARSVAAAAAEIPTEVALGRAGGPAALALAGDPEISGRHALVSWSPAHACWQVADLGSLNGTLLNGEPIGAGARARGRAYRVGTDDVLQLGSATQVKVAVFPREMLPGARASVDGGGGAGALLPAGSLPRSLTMPKRRRVPSFSSLLSPRIGSSPTRGRRPPEVVAAFSEELRLECAIAARVGRDHARRGQPSEDVACAECPLRGAGAGGAVDSADADGASAGAGGAVDSADADGASAGAPPPAALFCLFDGHCGGAAAEAAARALPEEIAARLPAAAAAMAAAGADVDSGDAPGAAAAAALREAFLATDARIAAEEGCTATAVLAWRGAGGAVLLQAANVGDSAALLIELDDDGGGFEEEDESVEGGREEGGAPGAGAEAEDAGGAAGAAAAAAPAAAAGPGWRVLTEDHRLSNPAERARLAAAGIPLQATSTRLYGLNLARALGDRFLKDEDLGLTAEPAVSLVAAVPRGRGALVLVASDGLWDVVSPTAAAALVRAADAGAGGSAVAAAEAAVAAAKAAGTRDDVTALVVRLWPAGAQPARSEDGGGGGGPGFGFGACLEGEDEGAEASQ